MNIISLDIETTGLDPDKHNIISIGAVNPANKQEFYREIYYKDLFVAAETMAFHKLDFTKNKGKQHCEPYHVICAFNTWLIEQYNYKPITLMGLNVGSFDLQFIKKLSQSVDSPGTQTLFDYRCLDLNSIMMYLATIGENLNFIEIKNCLTEKAERNISWDKPEIDVLGKHNALYDAWFNVYLWNLLMKG